MTNCLPKLSSSLLLLIAVAFPGCGDGRPEPIVPNKPALSAEEAKEKNEKLQRSLLKTMEQMKQSKK